MQILPPYEALKVVKNQHAYSPTIDSNVFSTEEEIQSIKNTFYQTDKISENDLRRFAELIAIINGLKYDEFDYTIQNESSYNRYAKSPNGGLCVGISQFLLSTWLANCSDKDDRTDPIKSLECMGKMWKDNQQFQWDAYCFKYYDENCINIRHLYPK